MLQVYGIGRLTKDPEVRPLQNNPERNMVTFRIAVSEWRNDAERTDFYGVTWFIEATSKKALQLKQGTQVMVDGAWATNDSTGTDGVKRTFHDVTIYGSRGLVVLRQKGDGAGAGTAQSAVTAPAYTVPVPTAPSAYGQTVAQLPTVPPAANVPPAYAPPAAPVPATQMPATPPPPPPTPVDGGYDPMVPPPGPALVPQPMVAPQPQTPPVAPPPPPVASQNGVGGYAPPGV